MRATSGDGDGSGSSGPPTPRKRAWSGPKRARKRRAHYTAYCDAGLDPSLPPTRLRTDPPSEPFVVLSCCDAFAGLECCICCETHAGVREDPYVMLACGHSFGRACLLRWLDAQRVCPVCRHDVD